MSFKIEDFNNSDYRAYELNKLDLFKKKIKENLNFKQKQKATKQFIIWNIVASFFRLFPIDSKKIYFESFLGRYYSDNPKALYEYLLECENEYNFVWGLNEPSKEILGKTKKVKRMKFKYLYHISTSKYIITNSRMPLKFKKRKNQVYIQTWHGTPLKKLVFDMEEVHLPGTEKEKYLNNFKTDVDKWDYLVSPNEYSTNVFKKAFKYDGPFLKSGYPRNDVLKNPVSDDTIKSIKEKLNINSNKKIILYTPTFRDDEYFKKGSYVQRLMLKFNSEMLENDCIILLRSHYLVNYVVPSFDNQKFELIDVSRYEDINDLYLVSDVLITDYSSTFFDYSILNKPILFYQYDHEKYKNVLRDFYLTNEQLPSQPIYTPEELENKLIDVLENGQEYQKLFKEAMNTDLKEYKNESSKYIYENILKRK